MLWYQILVIILFVIQLTLGILGIFLKGKSIQGINSKELYEKNGGEWYDNNCGGTWFEKSSKTYKRWYNIMYYCLSGLVLYVFAFLAAFYY